jgi:hypothetical protein
MPHPRLIMVGRNTTRLRNAWTTALVEDGGETAGRADIDGCEFFTTDGFAKDVLLAADREIINVIWIWC